MNYFSYRSSLFKLNRRRKKIDDYYKKQYLEAKGTGDKDKTQEIGALATAELQEVDDEIQYLEQRYLISIATRMLLPVPELINEEEGGLWEQSVFTGNWLLTSRGITELRKIIRTEKKKEPSCCHVG